MKNNRRILVFLNMSSKPGKSGACSFSLYHRFYSLLTKGPSALFLDLAQAGPFSERG